MERAVDGAIRLGRAWKALSGERRSAAIAAGVLWVTLFLPWYQASVVSRNPRTRSAAPTGESLSGWAAFSGVEALLLILSLGVILLLFLRAEGRISFSPASDGWAVTVAGAISVFLIILGLFNAPSPASRGHYVLSTGLEWGIFLALLAAIALTWAGGRIRNSLEEDPILAGKRHRSPGGTAGDASAAQPATAKPGAAAAKPAAASPTTAPKAGAASPGSSAPSNAAPKRSATPAAPADSMTEANRLGVVEPLTGQTTAGAGQPLTAAAAQAPRPVRAAPSGPDPVVQPSSAPDRPSQDKGVPDDRDQGHGDEDVTVADQPEPASRSDWRPAERPAWSDPVPEHPVGWLTARAKHQESDAEHEAPTRQGSADEPEQLTIPLDPDE